MDESERRERIERAAMGEQVATVIGERRKTSGTREGIEGKDLRDKKDERERQVRGKKQ